MDATRIIVFVDKDVDFARALWDLTLKGFFHENTLHSLKVLVGRCSSEDLEKIREIPGIRVIEEDLQPVPIAL